jgi:hypothetical protein
MPMLLALIGASLLLIDKTSFPFESRKGEWKGL